jgi:hypothetical protein
MEEWRYNSTILDLGTGGRVIISSFGLFTLKKDPSRQWARRLGRSKGLSGNYGIEKTFFLLPGIEHRPSIS